MYFKATCLPLAQHTPVGNLFLTKYVSASAKRPLLLKILAEFEERPRGLHLPQNRIVKRQDGTRITRVAWKIVRALYYRHHEVVLPDLDLDRINCTMTPAGENPSDHFVEFKSRPDVELYGVYPGVFNYAFDSFDLGSGRKLHYWAFVLWDSMLFTLCFHDPWNCPGELCGH